MRLAVYLFGFSAAVVLLALLAAMARPFFSVLLTIAASRMILAALRSNS